MEWRVLPFFTFVLCNGNEVAISYSLIYDHLSPNLNKRSKNKGYALAFFKKKKKSKRVLGRSITCWIGGVELGHPSTETNLFFFPGRRQVAIQGSVRTKRRSRRRHGGSTHARGRAVVPISWCVTRLARPTDLDPRPHRIEFKPIDCSRR